MDAIDSPTASLKRKINTMKFSTPSSITPLKKVISHVRYSGVNNNPDKTFSYGSSGATAVNNFKSKSIYYQDMNERVKALDNRFKGLTAPEKAAWTAALPVFSTVPICGCPGNINTAQKLYRLTNYFALLIGLGIYTMPPVPIPTSTCTWGSFGLITGIEGFWNVQYTALDIYGVMNLGKGLQNPIYHHPPFTDATPFYPPDPLYEQLLTLPPTGNYTVCTFDPRGYPLGTSKAIVYRYP